MTTYNHNQQQQTLEIMLEAMFILSHCCFLVVNHNKSILHWISVETLLTTIKTAKKLYYSEQIVWNILMSCLKPRRKIVRAFPASFSCWSSTWSPTVSVWWGRSSTLRSTATPSPSSWSNMSSAPPTTPSYPWPSFSPGLTSGTSSRLSSRKVTVKLVSFKKIFWLLQVEVRRASLRRWPMKKYRGNWDLELKSIRRWK